MDDFATLAALAALAYKVTSLLKYATSGQVRSAVTTVVPWAAGFLVLLVGAQADATAAIMLPGLREPLGQLDVWSLMLAGTTIGAVGSAGYDLKSAVDNTDTAVEPPLASPSGPRGA